MYDVAINISEKEMVELYFVRSTRIGKTFTLLGYLNEEKDEFVAYKMVKDHVTAWNEEKAQKIMNSPYDGLKQLVELYAEEEVTPRIYERITDQKQLSSLYDKYCDMEEKSNVTICFDDLDEEEQAKVIEFEKLQAQVDAMYG